jgi:spoIIIJ-associated protein
VRPTTPRPKDDRRRRRERRGDRRETGGRRGGERERDAAPARDEQEPKGRTATVTDRGVPAARGASEDRSGGPDENGGDEVEQDLSVPEQAELARRFVVGLVDAFGLRADVATTTGDDLIDVAVTGDDLGVLIGPKGATLQAIQELARTAVQRQTSERVARLHVDVAGYREKRRVALERFTQQQAELVKSTGERRVLEPMSAADRKIVHDTANTIDGVTTTSEGEEPRRRVVILPADAG